MNPPLKMAVSMPKKKLKKSKKANEIEPRDSPDSCVHRVFNKVSIAIFLIVIIFLWSSSSTIISGSIVHVCITSRKLNNLYCFSASAQPSNYTIPLPLINNSSRISVDTNVNTQQAPSTILSVSDQQNSISSNHNNPSNPSVSHNSQLNPDLTTLPTLSWVLRDNSIGLSDGVTKGGNDVNALQARSATITTQHDHVNGENQSPSTNTNSIPSSVTQQNLVPSLRDGPPLPKTTRYGIELPIITDESKTKVRDGILKEASVRSSSFARKEVEGHMAVLRSYIPKSKPTDCYKRGIYVYDLPTKFNKDLLSQCSEMITGLNFCKFLMNDGMGEPIPELGKGWYNTHQYNLELIFHFHILKHPCRVKDIEKAKLFYVPFYGGLDTMRWHFKKVPNDVKDTLSNELIEWLEDQRPWRRNFGLDHVFVLGKISWDFRRWENATWGTRLLELDEMQNPMKLLIERQPWHDNDVGVPHPTYFHPSTDQDVLEWQSKIRRTRRRHLVSFAGAPQRASASIRSILIEQCTETSNDNICRFFDCREQACVNPAPVMRLFMESEFCMQPPGDSPTRKSVFDSLIAGCIPVVFDPHTAHYHYPWHLPEEYRKYSVYVDQAEVRRSEVNVIEKLVKIPLEEREEMRRYIIDELVPRLVYSNPTGKLEKFEDAFTVSMNNLLEMAVRKVPSFV